MSIKDLIQTAYDKNASAFENAFNDIMSSRMESAISDKYDEMFESKYEDEEDEDEDNEDEDDEDEDEDEDED